MPFKKMTMSKSIGHGGTRYFQVNEERRTRLRFIINRPVEVQLADGQVLQTVAHNISTGGVQLMCDRVSAFMLHPSGREIRSNEEEEVKISLGLPLARQIQLLEAQCRIGYIAVAPDVGVAIGLIFRQLLRNGEEVLNAFLEESLDPPPIWLE